MICGTDESTTPIDRATIMDAMHGPPLITCTFICTVCHVRKSSASLCCHSVSMVGICLPKIVVITWTLTLSIEQNIVKDQNCMLCWLCNSVWLENVYLCLNLKIRTVGQFTCYLVQIQSLHYHNSGHKAIYVSLLRCYVCLQVSSHLASVHPIAK